VRLFIGIDIDPHARPALSSAAEALRERVEQHDPTLVARWVPAENLHITLWFIGEVNEPRAAAVLSAVDAPFGTRACRVQLGGCGVFPPSGAPRVFWIGVRRGSEALTALYAELTARLQPLGFEPERRPYSAHLTIARIKDIKPGGYGAMRAVVQETRFEPVDCDVDAVTVFQSKVGSKGATYTPVLRVPLGEG